VPFSINITFATPTQCYAVDVVMLKIYIMLLAVVKRCSMIKWYVKNAIVRVIARSEIRAEECRKIRQLC
jgi:hypothetical protein